MIANFFRRGDEFGFLNRLVVGHKVMIWISGEELRNDYWLSDVQAIEVQDVGV
jgi:hypothetical protein